MLRAIAIYDTTDFSRHGKNKEVNSAQQDKSSLFPSDQLSDLKKYTLARIPHPIPEEWMDINYANKEYHYIKKLPSDQFIIAICSKKLLDPSELCYLFINIRHAHVRPERSRIMLDHIILNPLFYTGQDRLIGQTKEELEELKDMMLMNVEAIMQRQEQLEGLIDKTDHLVLNSTEFRKKSKELNRGCCRIG